MIDAQALMDQMFSTGWDGIEKAGARSREALQAAGEEQKRAYLEKARIVAKALDTEDGRAALKVLLEMTLARPPSDEENEARTAESYALAKKLRDGQNNIVFTIFEMLRAARGEERHTGGEPS